MNRKERQQAAWTTAATIMTLAWPTIVEQVMQTAVQYIDTAMVGSLGTQATAAVGATSTIAWLVGSTFSALGVGFLALIAKACGAGDLEAAKKRRLRPPWWFWLRVSSPPLSVPPSAAWSLYGCRLTPPSES